MELSSSYRFAAPADTVWNLLIDPDVVSSCVPGCERLEPLGDDRYKATLTLSVAAIGGQYTGTLAILDKQPPRSYRLQLEGKGKGGFVTGEAAIELREQDGATDVTVNGRGNVGGVIAAVGQRMLGTVSKMMMDRFFACLQSKVTRTEG
jgi:carbon monoxide dehydrogenase subunit G